MRRLCAVLALFVSLLLGADPASDEQQTWKDFLAWFRTYTGLPLPPEVLKAYSGQLLSQGIAQTEVDRRIDTVKKVAASAPTEALAINFNNIYSNHREFFNAEPNALVVRTVRGLKPGKALDVAMGEGRNAVFLAKQGWDVTGYDISDQGMAIARDNAEKAGSKIQTVLATHKDFDYGVDRWDLIVMTYSLVNMDDAAFLKRLTASLKPGGILILEQPNSGGSGKGPKNALLGSFPDLRVLFYEDTVATAEWGHFQARIGRLVAQKD
jgi:2-polyprenyl-3-methyl-5-hydroxy-6-metoxy-1,4-benzoquinol methylase